MTVTVQSFSMKALSLFIDLRFSRRKAGAFATVAALAFAGSLSLPLLARGASPLEASAGQSPRIADAQTAPTVGIVATDSETREPTPYSRVAPAVLTLTRAGSTADPLTVFLTYAGTATPGVDYDRLAEAVSFPPGVAAVELAVQAFEDAEREGVETVVATLNEGPNDGPVGALPAYVIDPARRVATAIIYDAELAPQPTVEITRPRDGDRFYSGQTVIIDATAVDPKSYIARVEFFDGEALIGVSEIAFIRAPDPGEPIHHTLEWQDPPPGERVLTARAVDSEGTRVVSTPVRIVVEPDGGGVPRVWVESIDSTAIEYPADADGFDPATFLISRNGDFGKEMIVYFTLHGTASTGADYKTLPEHVIIPAGKGEAAVEIAPLSDEVPEGMETVALRILDPKLLVRIPEAPQDPYFFEPYSRTAAAVIFEGAPPETGAVELALPDDDEVILQWQPLPLIATAFHPTLDLTRVNFYAGDDLIGSSEIVFFKPNGGGVIVHRFDWEKPVSGEHVITARAELPDGSTLISSPISVSIVPANSPVVLEVVATDPEAAELGKDDLPDPAVFTIRRIGGPSDVAVTVWYGIEGSAMNGVDYARLEGTVALPADDERVEVLIHPVLDKALEGDESVVLRLRPPACPAIYPLPAWCYQIGEQGAAKAVIQDYGTAPGNLPLGTIVFNRIERQRDGSVRLHVAGPAGLPCILEASSDLVTWTEIAPVLLPDGVIEHRDEASNTGQQRFYRTRLP